ncbi:hypothetical protein D3C81_198320 [compost metagenome]
MKTKEKFNEHVLAWFSLNKKPIKTIDTDEKILYEVDMSIGPLKLTDKIELSQERIDFWQDLEDENTKLLLLYKRTNEQTGYTEENVLFSCFNDYPLQFSFYKNGKVEEYSNFLLKKLAESKQDIFESHKVEILEKKINILQRFK